ncbi:hypothetical protein Tco_0623595, partial [Tanacetum coccineum]
QHCLFAFFLSKIKPKKISEAHEDESWVDAMQEELLHLEPNGSTGIRRMKEVLWLEIRQDWLPRDIDKRKG